MSRRGRTSIASTINGSVWDIGPLPTPIEIASRALTAALRLFLQVVQQSLHEHCPGAEQVDKAALRIGAVVSIYRFDSSLNTHVHFHAASGLDGATVAQVLAAVRRRLLHAFVVRGH